ncbi:MAG: hypothetical protein RL291_1249 [Pseudomonadota bacterium]|jgi:hypothetical protein
MTQSLIARFVPHAASLPRGTVIVLNCETGDYVSAATEAEALDTFGARFGWGVSCVVHVVG